ncbi:MAG: L,D-transpeptidase [Sandaracinaceae bacterium]
MLGRPGRGAALAAGLAVAALTLGAGCAEPTQGPTDEADEGEALGAGHPPVPAAPPDPEPPPLLEPVPYWSDGRAEGEVDAARAADEGFVALDLGESWTPYLFTERDGPDGERIPHGYRATYLALARGEHPDDHHGARAERDKYLELYGIPPTLGLLRARFQRAMSLPCAAELDLEPLRAFDDFAAYTSNPSAQRRGRAFDRLERQVGALVEAQDVPSEAELDVERLNGRAARTLQDYRRKRPRHAAIRAAQDRLECEGYFEGKGRYQRGAFDWATHEALAEFERRHRIYGWGYLGRDTLEALRETPAELERRAVIRVLTERAMHALGVLEDGTAPPSQGGEARVYRDVDGQVRTVPNLEAELRARVVDAFGLQTPESTLAFLEGLGELVPGEPHVVAFDAPELPPYYGDDMEIRAVIDRGDIWYEFPYGPDGTERPQPVERRPRITIYVEHADQRIPIARYGTTVGGWRSEVIDGVSMWRYKNSPPGRRIWRRILSAPVWLPPESTPARDLLTRGRRPRINYHETGPSYASAYGLVAAYHLMYRTGPEGEIVDGGDEGIRTHGSVDYMSIMRRHSHGCHRLHNHIAVRLMSWVLAHRPHRRVGHVPHAFRRELEHDGRTYELAIDQGGYAFELERPVPVVVLNGRIRGSRSTPIEIALPKYDRDVGAYVLPDGGAVAIARSGQMTPRVLDMGRPDAAVDAGAVMDDVFGEALGAMTGQADTEAAAPVE